MSCKCSPIVVCDECTRYAKPCKVCGGYYPGDCFRDGCKDPTCSCDGCNIHFKRDDER